MKFYYDFHIHSALSPCGDEDMTPNNIVNMAAIKGLDIIALTDHNSILNCEAAIEAAKGLPLMVLPGMELCTAEECHIVCIFPHFAECKEFYDFVKPHYAPIKNKPEIFGRQLIMDSEDEIIGEEEILLTTSTDITTDKIHNIADNFGGVAFPAHIDRPSYSVLAMLGFLTPDMGFRTAELSKNCKSIEELMPVHSYLQNYRIVKNSDAHYLGDISERENFLELEELTATGVIEWLKNCHK